MPSERVCTPLVTMLAHPADRFVSAFYQAFGLASDPESGSRDVACGFLRCDASSRLRSRYETGLITPDQFARWVPEREHRAGWNTAVMSGVTRSARPTPCTFRRCKTADSVHRVWHRSRCSERRATATSLPGGFDAATARCKCQCPPPSPMTRPGGRRSRSPSGDCSRWTLCASPGRTQCTASLNAAVPSLKRVIAVGGAGGHRLALL